jgi:hypothetical protein
VQGRNDIAVELSSFVSTEPVITEDGTVTPTGFKYSINITGSPSTTLENSSWAIVKLFASNRFASTRPTASNSEIIGGTDDTTNLGWVTDATIDSSVVSSIYVYNDINVSLTAAFNSIPDGKTRDWKYDSLCQTMHCSSFQFQFLLGSINRSRRGEGQINSEHH